MKVPLARPDISEDDIQAVVRVLRSGRLSQGSIAREFEEALAAHVGVAHGVVVNSGTSALDLALRALRIGDGDEVILPSFSFMAVTNAVLAVRAVPVFVDIDPRNLNMDPAAVGEAVSEKTKAIILVHSFGLPAAAEEIVAFGKSHSLAVIEDACEALGTARNGHKAGSLGNIGVLAFYPNKVITTGEGGALITNSSELAVRVRSLSNQGRRSGAGWFEHLEPGFSCRLSDLGCALGLQQLSRIAPILRRREELAASYYRRLQLNTHLSCFAAASGNERASWFTYPILLNETFTRQDRDEIWIELKRRGIETGRYFAPSHLQPALRGVPHRCGDLSRTISLSERLLCLPLFGSLSEAQIDSVCEALDEILNGRTCWRGAAQAAVNW